MKRIVMGVVLVSAISTAFAVNLSTETQKVSYAMGYETGKALRMHQVSADPNTFAAGMKSGLNNTTPAMTEDNMQKTLQQFQTENAAKFAAAQKEQADTNAKLGADFLAKNKGQAGVVTLPSGLQYKILNAGDAAAASPKATDRVTVDYEGTLINGTVFDSSYKRGQPATFGVNQVIPGWTQALQLMKPGATWMLFIPPNLAYGANGAGPTIGPNSTLIFKVHLISVAS